MEFSEWWSQLGDIFRDTYGIEIAEVYDENFGRRAYECGETAQEVCDRLGDKYDLTKRGEWTVEGSC